MNPADDPKVRELNERIQVETDPQKLSQLVDELAARLDELDRKPGTSRSS
jgi:hypothetical protein